MGLRALVGESLLLHKQGARRNGGRSLARAPRKISSTSERTTSGPTLGGDTTSSPSSQSRLSTISHAPPGGSFDAPAPVAPLVAVAGEPFVEVASEVPGWGGGAPSV